MTSFNLNYFLKGPICKYIVTLGVRVTTYGFENIIHSITVTNNVCVCVCVCVCVANIPVCILF